MQHRSLLIFKLRSLQSLDGVIVTSEERHTAELTFSDRQVKINEWFRNNKWMNGWTIGHN